MEVIPAIRQHVADRLAKLEKQQTYLINPHIILSREPQGSITDTITSTSNGHSAAGAKHKDIYTTINDLINKLERQLDKVWHKGEACHATTSVKDVNFVEAEEEQSLTSSVSPTRLRARFLLTG